MQLTKKITTFYTAETGIQFFYALPIALAAALYAPTEYNFFDTFIFIFLLANVQLFFGLHLPIILQPSLKSLYAKHILFCLFTTTIVCVSSSGLISFLKPSLWPQPLIYTASLYNVVIQYLLLLLIFLSSYQQKLSYKKSSVHATAQIHSLQARIRPHFLFNSMNMLAELIPSDPRLAEDIIIDLAVLFRSSLKKQTITVPVSEEVDLCQKYCRIEQLRLGTRLNVNWHLPEKIRGKMPLFVLQPIIENAVYHGIQQIDTGGTIVIKLIQDESQSIFIVTNPVVHNEIAHQGSGYHIAHENIEQRLSLLYGHEAECSMSHDKNLYSVTLKIPLESKMHDESSPG